jgi:glycerate-2-kinase
VSAPEILGEIYREALAAVHAGRAVERALAGWDADRVELLAVGKAACAMAAGARAALGPRLRGGLAVTKPAHGFPVAGVEVREAGHPLPDARGAAAAEQALARAAASKDPLLVLVSGGASALWPAPVAGVSLEDKRATTELLLRSGADIAALNAVRKHLSRIKGGGLARAAAGRRVLALLVSDVAGDAPDAIGSGPTAPDPTTYADALRALRRADLLERVPRSVRGHLEAGAAGRSDETPKPGDEIFARVEHRIVARLADALRAASAAARARGFEVRDLGRALDGDVAEVARSLARHVRAAGSRRVILVAGGEPTLVVRGGGVGGRAQHLALALALELEGERGWTALCAGSDGTDGITSAAGAAVDAGTLARARASGLDPADHLARRDTHPLLRAIGALVETGPTHTNVNDLALVALGADADLVG